MNTPLDIAVDIGRILNEAKLSRLPLDLSQQADKLFQRFAETGVPRAAIRATLEEEAGAIGMTGAPGN